MTLILAALIVGGGLTWVYLLSCRGFYVWLGRVVADVFPMLLLWLGLSFGVWCLTALVRQARLLP